MNVGKVGHSTDLELVAESLLKCRLHIANHGLAAPREWRGSRSLAPGRHPLSLAPRLTKVGTTTTRPPKRPVHLAPPGRGLYNFNHDYKAHQPRRPSSALPLQSRWCAPSTAPLSTCRFGASSVALRFSFDVWKY
jgi:hypothetical protein